MLKPVNLKVNYTKPEYAIADTQKPVFSWGCENMTDKECFQTGYRIVVFCNNIVLWDSGVCNSVDMQAVYSGAQLPSGAIVNWKLSVVDNYDNVSNFVGSSFKTACYDALCADWIEPECECEGAVVHFKKIFDLDILPERAVLFYCGLGLSKPFINNNELDNYRLQPAFTNYKKQAQYVTEPIDVSLLKHGENELEIMVAGGWRKNYGKYLENMSSDRQIEFMGNICLWCQMVLYYECGETVVISSDSTWTCATKNITYSHLFNGEIYDETAVENNLGSVVVSQFEPSQLIPQSIEPVCIKREIAPTNIYTTNGVRIYDFGENLAGVPRLKAKGVGKKLCFVIRHAEEVSETGELFTDTLRSAKATDKYICCDGDIDIDFSPMFTYHGFRFASVEICGEFDGEIELSALSFYSDVDADAHFCCGNQTMNEIYKSVLRTERCNIHSIASDCPQRDERLAWMNDATVRFMSMPYNFNIARLFEKISDDIVNEQGDDGSLTCTAPFVFGERPADPVCSSLLIAVYEYYKFTGNDSLIRKHYNSMAKWNECLKSHAPEGIVDYSYYGDWAGPADCCYSTQTIGNSDVLKTEEYDPGAANSLCISGEMMSTAIYYMNLRMMEYFGNIIGEDTEIYTIEKNRIQKAYLDKWFDKTHIKIGSNSQAECAVSLFVGIIPEKYENAIAEKMALAVTEYGERIRTANITTPMLFDMLTKYGYTDIAWNLITSDKYPSVGYMLSSGATTIWERFELKKESGMNSHNHPMYGAMIGWLYRGLLGFKTIIPCKKYELHPHIPDELRYLEIKIPLLNGTIYFKYENKYGKKIVNINVPLGIDVDIYFDGEKKNLKNGFSSLQYINND